MQELDELYSITIPQLINRNSIGEGLNENFLITDNIREYIEVLSFPLRADAFIIGICLKGYIKISINLKDFVLTEDSCIINLPENVIGVQEVSEDFEGGLIAVSQDFLKEMNLDLKSIMPHYILVRNYPCVNLSQDEIRKFMLLHGLILETLKGEESKRKADIVKGLFSAVVFQLCENLDRISSNNKALKTKSKEYYFVRFMELLLHNFKTSRQVQFYSDKLSVTPKYLSTLIKEVSGISAAQWIDEYIIMEASILLKFSDKSIQQIADQLHFPNQSFFSKYFKNQTGKTPTEYRENKRKLA